MTVEIENKSSEKAARDGRGRGIAVWVLLVVAGLLLLLTSFAVWVDRVALNTPRGTKELEVVAVV